MFSICYNIAIGDYKLGLLESVEIHKSVDLLAQTATIMLPGVAYNKYLKHEEYIKAGDKVTIEAGYDDKLEMEFEGFVVYISTDDNNMTIACEDNMYFARQPVPDKQLSDVSIKQVAEYCLSELGMNKLDCDYDISFERFVIKSLNGFQVFKKLKEDTGAQIYMVGEILHIHFPYSKNSGEATYDFAVNIETADLKYRSEEGPKHQVEVQGTGLDGKDKKVTVGAAGGEKSTVKVTSVMSDADMKKRGEAELKFLIYRGFEGSVTGWLIPRVAPAWRAQIIEEDYKFKEGIYYVNAVTTTVSSHGGVRKVELGVKLS